MTYNIGIDKGSISQAMGMKLVSSPFLMKTEQVKFPRSKRKRMRKKWSKNKNNFENVPDDTHFYMVDLKAMEFYPGQYDSKKMVFMHPNLMEKVEGLIEK